MERLWGLPTATRRAPSSSTAFGPEIGTAPPSPCMPITVRPVFAPMFAWLWVRLGRRQPASPAKFSIGLIGVGLGFLILVPAAQSAMTGTLVSPGWLFTTYLIHTFAELCLSPVGLSAMTKLAPARIVSLMMGVWFLATSVGNYAGGQIAALYETMPLDRLLMAVAVLPIAAGLVMLVARRSLASLMGSVR